MKVVRILAIALGVYVLLGLVFDAAVGYFQPQGEGTVVLRTFDPGGTHPHETVVVLRPASDGTLWVESGHWFRGWYHRLERNPDLVLVRHGEARPYHAVLVDDPPTVEKLEGLMGKPAMGYYVGRTLLLWAPIKPVRLDPRPAAGQM
jgi:hypothetical protein